MSIVSCPSVYERRDELRKALVAARQGEIVVLVHPWNREVPCGMAKTVVKVLCGDRRKLIAFGQAMFLPEHWIHDTKIPHFDLWGKKAENLVLRLKKEGVVKDGLSSVILF